MKIADHKNFGAGLMFALLGGFVALRAPSLGLGDLRAVGAGFFPLLAGSMLALVGVALMAATMRAGAKLRGFGVIAWRPLFTILGAVILFTLLLKPAGFFVASAALLVTASFAAGPVDLRRVGLSVAVLLPASWLIFSVIVGLRLPLWPQLLSGG